MDYAKYAKLSKEKQVRVDEINRQISELERERAKIFRNKATIFDEERDYLASKIDGFYVKGTNRLHRNVRMNPKYGALWTGMRQAAEYSVFRIHKLPDTATDEQIEQVRRKLIEMIDEFDKSIIQAGLLW